MLPAWQSWQQVQDSPS
ncbi:hypothetical protein VCHE09_2464, partial [Vibrio paracholerae HE-09]